MEEIEALAKPIIDFLSKKFDPHTSVIITTDHIKILRDEISIPIKND